MKLQKFEEQIFFATVRVFSTGADGTASLGTVFLVQEAVTADRSVILGISNKHVLIDPGRQFVFDFTVADLTKHPVMPLLGATKRIQGNALNENAYFEHPDDGVDLACVNLSPLGEGGIFYKTLDLGAMSATFEEDWLLPNRDVCFVGYPEGFYDEKYNLPILRRGVAASIPKIDFNGKKQFLIDAHVYQGSSGSPVFMIEGPFGGQVRFVGVLTAGVRRQAKLTKLNFDKFGVEHTIGLGHVLKPQLVRELVSVAVERIKKTLPVDPQPTVDAEAMARQSG